MKSQEQAELKISSQKPNRVLKNKAVESGIVKLRCKIQLSEVANSYATVCCVGAGFLGAILMIHDQILHCLFNFFTSVY